MSVAIKQKIFGLEISVDDILGMKVFQGQSDFGRIEFGDRVRESLVMLVYPALQQLEVTYL